MRVVRLRYVSQRTAQADGELSVADQESESAFALKKSIVSVTTLSHLYWLIFRTVSTAETVAEILTCGPFD